MFLMETKHCRDDLVEIQVWLGYDRVYTVNPEGLSGGLALFCKKNIKMDVKFADKNMIDCLVQFGENTFFLSCIYGEPATEGRDAVWERLNRIGTNRKEPWCLIGDFNEILSFPSITANASIWKELHRLEEEFHPKSRRYNRRTSVDLDRCPTSREEIVCFLNELGWLLQK